MGLFDMFKKKAEPAAAAAPASISTSAGADVLCSPVKGKVIKMADVPALNQFQPQMRLHRFFP